MTLPTLVNTPNPRGRGFGASLDDLLLRLAVGPGRQLTIEPAPKQAPRVDTSENPLEHVQEFGDVFARDDFTGGEGLRHAHRRDRPANAPARFWDSRNVDVSAPPDRSSSGVRLLAATEQVDAQTDTNLTVAGALGAVYMAAGTEIRATDDPTASTPTFSTLDPHDGETAVAVDGVAVLGTDVYAALGVNGIHRDTGTGWAHWSDLTADGIWAAEGRIIATDAESIYEVVAAGAAPSPLKTLSPGIEWTDVAEAGAAILASATDGYIYSFAADDSGTFGLQAQSLIPGEQPMCVTSAQGLVVYGTRQTVADGVVGRLWRAELNSDLVLSDRQLLRQWGDETTVLDRAPRRLLASREEVFAPIVESADETHLWRYDLASGGIVRSYVLDAGGVGQGIVMVEGRVFVSVSADGLWRQAETLAASGYLIGPMGDHFTAEAKSWVSGRLDTDSVEDGQRVELFYTTDEAALDDPDSGLWRRIKRLSSGTDTLETSLGGVSSRGLAGMVRLYPSTDTVTSPQVHAFAFRSYPGPGDLIVTFPVNVSDQIAAPNRRHVQVRGRGHEVFAALLDRDGRQALLHVFRPPLRLRGLVEAVGTPVEVMGPRGSVSLYSMVRFRGRVATLSTTVDPSTMGVAEMGVSIMGGVT